ncbi:putative nuclease HARBI1 [Haliotis rubra]|uniref:putative nuclease HARBI1 n=1 Tax=Haliotis rubra TaxID=36100 RepID=UPI001EE5CB7B|nr:putative nuclease HARBI1 [Haliotis rubra]
MQNELTSPTKRNFSVDADIKVAITLRYLATGKMQMCNGEDFSISQPSIRKIIPDTISALCQPALIRRFIKMPTQRSDMRRRHQGQFRAIAGFPGVVGVIDGTHICVIAPSEHEVEYVNRKNFRSLNVQLIFDSEQRICDVVAKWPMVTHDARILNESGMQVLFEMGIMRHGCHLLGDRASCQRWLLTPFIQPQTGQQARYNRSHKATRCVVERGIGQLAVIPCPTWGIPPQTTKYIKECSIPFEPPALALPAAVSWSHSPHIVQLWWWRWLYWWHSLRGVMMECPAVHTFLQGLIIVQ